MQEYANIPSSTGSPSQPRLVNNGLYIIAPAGGAILGALLAGKIGGLIGAAAGFAMAQQWVQGIQDL